MRSLTERAVTEAFLPFSYINSHIASEDDRKRFGLRYNREEILRDITLKRAVPSFEFREKDREGRIRWARMDFHAVRQNDGDLLLYGYARNIDEQKRESWRWNTKPELILSAVFMIRQPSAL